MDALINLIALIISQCIHILNHHIVHLIMFYNLNKLNFLFVDYTSMNLEKKFSFLKASAYTKEVCWWAGRKR